MKNVIRKSIGAILLTGTLITALAQSEVTTTTTSEGTVSEFGPQTMVIKTATGTAPVAYSYSKTTTYVDEAGKPVAVTTVKSGIPVTVYYTKTGDALVASKVIVRKAAVVPSPVLSPVVEETKTTTTTTETK